MFDSACSIILLFPFYEKIEKKFSLFLEFSREVEVEYENTEIFDDITKDAPYLQLIISFTKFFLKVVL
jgi:hypothetical protein